MGKGSKQRPRQVSNDEYAARWEAIFGAHPKEETEGTQEDAKEETDDNHRTTSRNRRGD